MKCPCCGAAELVQATHDLTYTYQGEQTTVPQVTGDFCKACGEAVLDPGQSDRFITHVGVFQRQVDAALINSSHSS